MDFNAYEENESLVRSNRKAAMEIKEKYDHLLENQHKFFVQERVIELKKNYSVGFIALSSYHCLQLLKSHITAYAKDIHGKIDSN